MLNHSAAASLFGFCACGCCPSPADSVPPWQGDDLSLWYLWTIRSGDAAALRQHREQMRNMGFFVEEFRFDSERSKYTFRASIPKNALSETDYTSLCAWDREHE